ncbi:MAG: hypothetical protein ABI821_18945 [Pseudomonadota bacterium]
MQKILGLLLLVAAGVYGMGAVKLSESGANRFLNELESLSLQGKSDQYCALLHENLGVSIRDHTAPEQPRDFDGGKTEFCEFVSMAAKGMSLIRPESHLTREDFTVTRSWLHPWTALVSYHETRSTRMTLVNVTLETESDDEWTLVNTIGGVKVLRLESHSRLAD